ncbi:unnamed protein product [Urochloa humidicola]
MVGPLEISGMVSECDCTVSMMNRQDERPDCRNDAVLEIKKLIEVNFQDQLDFASFEASGLQTLN